MYLSKIIKTNENIYIYDALNNKFAYLQSEDDIYNETKYAEFLAASGFRDVKIPCEFDIRYPYSEEELEKMHSSKMKSMTLALTEQCNLRCKYCGYMSKYLDNSYIQKEMSKDIAFRAIDILMENSYESELCNVGFYGGEPLLRLDLIKECVTYIKEKYPFRKPSYNIVTNAVLLNENVADFLIENDIKINISLDGPTEKLNKYRVFGNGESSFDKVFENIQTLYNKNPQYFRESVTYNVVVFNGPNKELYDAIDRLWKSNVNIIDLVPTEYFSHVRDESDKHIQKEKMDIKSYDFAYENMLKNMKKYYNSFCVETNSNTILPGGFCIPGVRKNLVTTDGKIIICEKVDESKEVFEIGDVYSGIDLKKVERLIQHTLKSVDKCKKCWAAKFCKICFKDILNVNEEFCEKSRKDVENELGYYLDKVSSDRDLINQVSNVSLI
jgi:uncharacterized protein